MLPALTLATNLLITTVAITWWLQVACGELEVDPTSKKHYISTESVENDEATRVKFAELLDDLAVRVRFIWILSNDRRFGTACGLRIGLSTAFLYHLISPVSKAHQMPDEHMRLYFQFATTLLHELGHIVYSYTHSNESFADPYIFLDDFMPEVELSWENWTFEYILCHCTTKKIFILLNMVNFGSHPSRNRLHEVALLLLMFGWYILVR